MRLIHRIELHAALRRTARDPDTQPTDQKAAAKILAHDEALAVLEARVDRAASRAGATSGPIQNFIQWLIDHQAALVAFIKEIIALFQL